MSNWRPFVKWNKVYRNLEIYRLYLTGHWTFKRLARKYKVSGSRIQQIVNEGKKAPKKYEAKKFILTPTKRALINLRIITEQLRQILEP